MTTLNLPAYETIYHYLVRQRKEMFSQEEIREEYRRLLIKGEYPIARIIEKRLSISESILNKEISDLIFESNIHQTELSKKLCEEFSDRGYNKKWATARSVGDLI
jgi:hypothetical protein